MPVELQELTVRANPSPPGPFHLELAGIDPAALRVRAFRGVEAMSRVYSYVVDLRTDESLVLGAELLGERASLRVPGGGYEKTVRGIVTRVRALGASAHTGRRYELRISPRVWLLSQRHGTRIFQDKTVPEIVAEIFAERQIASEDRLTRRYPRRTYCVQYDETDLAFVERLLAEEGIFYFFTHDEEAELIILGDDSAVYVIAPGEWIQLRGQGLQSTDDHIVTFTSSCTIRPGTATIREFDFTRPALRLTASVDVGADRPGIDQRPLEVFDHYDDLECADVSKEAAQLHLDAHRRRALTFRGTGPTRRITPGAHFRLDWPDASDLGDDFVVVSCKHTGQASAVDAGGETGAPVHECTFSAVPADVRYRPKRPKRRAQQTLETATVVGPKDDEIHVDALGRIKVQFHWDRHGADDERSSCWIRVMQPWAGTGWGVQLIPRVGMEVVVQFVTGDTDKPVVLGALYNTEHPLPFPLPESRTKSGVVTKSTPRSAGYNELSFDDAAGHERVHLRAEKDLDEHVKGARTARIGGADTTSVGGNMTLNVARHAFASAQKSMTLSAFESLQISGEDCNVDAEKSLGLVAKEGALRLEAGLDAILDARNIAVEARQALSVAATTALHVRTAGRLDLLASELAVVAPFTTITAPNLEVRGSVTIQGTELVIQMGSSTLKMNDDGVEIVAKTVKLLGEDSVSLQGSSSTLGLDGDVEAIGKTTALYGSSAELELGKNATLKGSAISLLSSGGKAGSEPTSESSSPSEPPALELSVYVGMDAAEQREGALVVRDGAGEELERRPGSAAARAAGGSLVYSLDPAAFEGMIEVTYEIAGRVLHVLGPANAAELRDDLVAKQLDRSDAQKGHRPLARPGRTMTIAVDPGSETDRLFAGAQAPNEPDDGEMADEADEEAR